MGILEAKQNVYSIEVCEPLPLVLTWKQKPAVEASTDFEILVEAEEILAHP